MALKRKRSSATFSSPLSDSSDASTHFSPLPFFYTQSKPVEPLHFKPTWSFPTYDDQPGGQHLNSRTRKRHRDNRPDEEQVYASTIHKLFDAQRQHPTASPILSQQQPSAQQSVQPQRSTLHSFWKIGQLPLTTPMIVDPGPGNTNRDSGVRCEDCDRHLQTDDAMDLDEEVLIQEKSCHACRRHVCDMCAVQGDARICLGCSG